MTSSWTTTKSVTPWLPVDTFKNLCHLKYTSRLWCFMMSITGVRAISELPLLFRWSGSLSQPGAPGLKWTHVIDVSLKLSTECYTENLQRVYHRVLSPWASYQIRKIGVCACAGNAGNVFPHRRFRMKPLVSDPGMHHGTCVTHVPWCMSGSLTCGGGENIPGIPGACAPAILRIWQEAHAKTNRSRTKNITVTSYERNGISKYR